MTKGGNGKPKMLGRLIFGEKRKQHISPSRHRSATRNNGNTADVPLSSDGGAAGNKNPVNIHDWAVWRRQLNEQMGNGMTDKTDLKQMRQFLHSNSFYQQHSRDPSNGRYNGVRLLFSIPHAKIKSELNDGSREVLNRNSNIDVGDTTLCDPGNTHPIIDDRTTTSVNSVSAGPSMVIDKTISQLLPKNLIGNTSGFLHVNEQMVAADTEQTRRSMRATYTAADRVHATLQKAVKDGNVLEKIKAFEMQAAAAQAESTLKAGGNASSVSTINHRMQPVTSIIQPATHRALSPAMMQPTQHPISPIPIQPESQQQYIRSHRGRHVHPVQPRRDGHPGLMIGRESRKGAHVLEPAHGDIILKRRTPSQKTINDEDYSMTAISPMGVPVSQGHHHRQHHYHHRASASRSRHRQEAIHEKRSSSHHDHAHKKHQQKQKETTTTSSSNKTSSRRRWLKGRKDTPTETGTENGKQDVSITKSNKNKKKNNDKEKLQSTKKTTYPNPKEKLSTILDNSHVYDISNTPINDQTITEAASPQPPSRIEEEKESDQEEQMIENKTNHISPKEEIVQRKECDTNIEQRLNKTKYHQKLSSTDGEIFSKVEEDTRFSRPTDDHAHRSELNDDDDEYKSEGDVFLEESYATNINSPPQSASHIIQRHSSQHSNEEFSSDRRWQWSKESGGLIEKSHRKKNQQSITILTRKTKTNEGEEQTIYETPRSEPIFKEKQSPLIITSIGSNDETNNNPISRQILYAIMNSKNKNPEQTTTDDFFENGPHTNPEETMGNITSTA